jgi:hypothetical protein
VVKEEAECETDWRGCDVHGDKRYWAQLRQGVGRCGRWAVAGDALLLGSRRRLQALKDLNKT